MALTAKISPHLTSWALSWALMSINARRYWSGAYLACGVDVAVVAETSEVEVSGPEVLVCSLWVAPSTTPPATVSQNRILDARL